MSSIVLLFAIVVIAMFPTLRCAVLHPIKVIRFSIIDLFMAIKRKSFNLCKTGELVAYVGLFGKGKTLSVVNRVCTAYNKYDGKTVWCSRRMAFVTQRIQVLSNVALNIPYERFESLSQIVYISNNKEVIDDMNDTLTITLILGDEFSVQMNSRAFKTNVDPLFLNTLLTCRHYHMSLFYTAQRFSHVDALLRQVTSYVIDCDKLWRFQRQAKYDAWEMENATSPTLIKPLNRKCWFVTNEAYTAYDTMACVGNLKKSVSENDMLTPEEILALQCNTSPNTDAIIQPSRRFQRTRRKQMK